MKVTNTEQLNIKMIVLLKEKTILPKSFEMSPNFLEWCTYNPQQKYPIHRYIQLVKNVLVQGLKSLLNLCKVLLQTVFSLNKTHCLNTKKKNLGCPRLAVDDCTLYLWTKKLSVCLFNTKVCCFLISRRHSIISGTKS